MCDSDRWCVWWCDGVMVCVMVCDGVCDGDGVKCVLVISVWVVWGAFAISACGMSVS